MIYKSDEEVILLIKAFEERTLPKNEWTHAAHLTVGLFYCLTNPVAVARNIMRDSIYWLNDTHGTPNTETSGYHETMTFFWLYVVEEFLRDRPRENLANLANELIAACSDSKLPLKYYSRELLFSPEARRSYIEPDLVEIANLTLAVSTRSQNSVLSKIIR